MIELQDPNIPIKNSLVDSDRIINHIQEKIQTNINWISHAYGKAYQLVSNSEIKSIYVPEVYIGTQAHGEPSYLNVSTDNDKMGSCFFLLGKEKLPNFSIGVNNWIEQDLSIVFMVNLELIDKALLDTDVFTQYLINDIRTLARTKLIGGGYRLKLDTIENTFKDVFREFSLKEVKQYMRAPLDAFRFNFKLSFQEDCNILTPVPPDPPEFNPLAKIVPPIWADMFEGRVLSEDGTFEDKSNLITEFENNFDLYENASLVITPNGYKEGKIFAFKPFDGSGDLDFSRNSTARRFNDNGLDETVSANVPRINYLIGGVKPSWLFEPQSTNGIPYSDHFTASDWVKINTSVVNDEDYFPRLDVFSDKIVADIGNGSHYVVDSLSGKSFTFYAKANGLNWVMFYSGNVNSNVYFDVSNGLIGTVSSDVVSAKIEDFGNGYYKCSVVVNTPSVSYRLYVSNSNNTFTFNGDGISGVNLIRAKAETLSYPTSDIFTNGSTVTRLGDLVINQNSDIIGQHEGVLLLDLNKSDFNSNSIESILNIRPSAGSFINLYLKVNGTVGCDFYPNGIYAFSILSASAVNGRFKVAIKYKPGDYKMFVNGVLQGSSSNSTILNSTLSVTNIRENGVITYNGYYGFKEITPFLTDSKIQEFTEL